MKGGNHKIMEEKSEEESYTKCGELTSGNIDICWDKDYNGVPKKFCITGLNRVDFVKDNTQ